jgi:hypothetical protein
VVSAGAGQTSFYVHPGLVSITQAAGTRYRGSNALRAPTILPRLRHVALHNKTPLTPATAKPPQSTNAPNAERQRFIPVISRSHRLATRSQRPSHPSAPRANSSLVSPALRLRLRRTNPESAILGLAIQPRTGNEASTDFARSSGLTRIVRPNTMARLVLVHCCSLRQQKAPVQGFSMGGTGLEPVTPSLSNAPSRRLARFSHLCRDFEPTACIAFAVVCTPLSVLVVARGSTDSALYRRTAARG